MQTVWQLGGHDRLVLFFSGWAMDGHPTAHVLAGEADVCTCFDYRTLTTEAADQWKSYREIVLIAWSTGVWAAEVIVGSLDLPITKAIAINGTPTTVHDETGIPRAIFQGTHDQLSPQTMSKFQRRMVGSGAAFSEFATIVPHRGLEEQKAELAEILKVDFEKFATNAVAWDRTIIGTDDAIFPADHQLRYWADRCEIEKLPLPHYPFFQLRSWETIASSALK